MDAFWFTSETCGGRPGLALPRWCGVVALQTYYPAGGDRVWPEGGSLPPEAFALRDAEFGIFYEAFDLDDVYDGAVLEVRVHAFVLCERRCGGERRRRRREGRVSAV